MKLIKLQLQNFMCFKDTTIDFPDSKLTNIYGLDVDRKTANGVGKSAIKEAILFAFYGRTKVSLSDLIKKGAKECKVILTFKAANKQVVIIRSYKGMTKLVIKINGNEVDFSKLKDKRGYIEGLVGMDYTTCINFCIFDAVRFEDLTSLSSSEIKRLMQLLFNYEKFTKIYDKLKENIRSNGILLEQLQTRNIHYFSKKRQTILSDACKTLTEQINSIRSKVTLLNDLKYKLGGTIATCNTIISRNRNKISWISNQTQCPTCKQPLTNKVEILNEYQTEINKNMIILKNTQARVQKIEGAVREHRTTRDDRVSPKQTRVHNLIQKLEQSQKNTVDTQKIKETINSHKVVFDVLKKFESYVMGHYVGYLEQILNEYLFRLIDIKCNISFTKQGSILTRSIDKFSMKLTRNGEEYSYMSLSSGERMLVAYAFKLAINTLSFKDTFLFIDEGFNRLDKTNKTKLLEMLQSSPFNQIFLISHDDAFTNLPLIFLEKSNNESSVLENINSESSVKEYIKNNV